MSIYHINSSLQVDIDVSRVPCDIGNMDVAYAMAICCISTPKVHMCLECHCSHIKCTYIYNIYIYYIDELACSLVVLLYASMIWMVHISSAYQYIHTFSTCTLHMQWNSSRIGCNKDSLVATDFDHKSCHMARATPTCPFSKHIGFSCIFHSNLLCHCASMQIPCYIIVWLCFYDRMSNTQKELRLFIKLDRKQLWHNTLD